ncbi:STAS domain-containing protein [Metabacillus sp. RGM 3146]|uniref:STAS domain-containing protein n=1 Tax=Metabacillus sp. RGM 3146 TaxID=3401092 RepID=UPI003B9A87DE
MDDTTKINYERFTEVILKELQLLEKEAFNNNVSGKRYSEDLTPWRLTLTKIYAETLTLKPEASIDKMKEWGEEFAGRLVEMDLPLDAAIHEVRFTRKSIGELIKQEAKQQSLTMDDFYKLISSFDRTVDLAIQLVSISYMRAYKNQMQTAQDAVDELAIPVVKIEEGVGILPIVGDIDTRRAELLMNTALNKSVELELEYLILDLSGVPVMDTMVAQQIFEVLEGLRITGITSKISGVRPELAITMTQLGLNFKQADSFSSLHQAIKSIQREENKGSED